MTIKEKRTFSNKTSHCQDIFTSLKTVYKLRNVKRGGRGFALVLHQGIMVEHNSIMGGGGGMISSKLVLRSKHLK